MIRFTLINGKEIIFPTGNVAGFIKDMNGKPIPGTAFYSSIDQKIDIRFDQIAAAEDIEARRLIVAEDGDLQRLEYVTHQMLGHQIVPPDVLEMLERWKKQLEASQ